MAGGSDERPGTGGERFELGPEWRWTPEQVRAFGQRVTELVVAHLASQPERPVFRPYPAAEADRSATEPAPRTGVSPDQVLGEFEERIEPYPFGNGHPRFWAWVNSPPTPIGAFAAALAAAMNPSVAGGNHAATHVERQVGGWLREMFGFPPGSMTLLTPGSSLATLTALAVARHAATEGRDRADGLQGRDAPLTLYVSDQTHSSVTKSAELLGLGPSAIRTIPTDERFRIRLDELDAAIAADRAAGLVPMAVVGTAGTVNTGAIDPLAGLVGACRRHGVWLHVDGAYGGPAILLDQFRAELEPIADADSLAVDPQKWMYVPVEVGAVLVRDGALMRDTFSLVPPYLRTGGADDPVAGPPWFSEFGFQQTRDFRALRVWMAMKEHGLDGYARALDHDVALAERLSAHVRATPELELLGEGLSIVCFRYRGTGPVGEADLDALNRRLLGRLQTGGEAFLSGTVLRDRFALRACIVNFRSMPADIDALVEAVLRLGWEVAAG